MAKKSSIEKNKHRAKLVMQYAGRRKKLKALAEDRAASPEDRFAARLKLAELPRNSAPGRLRNRCEISGRPRGFIGKMKMSRIAVRDLGARGLIPGLVKSSW